MKQYGGDVKVIKYRITNTKTQTAYITSDADSVYGYVEKISGDEWEAIEASSWADIASVDDTYERDDFTVEVIED